MSIPYLTDDIVQPRQVLRFRHFPGFVGSLPRQVGLQPLDHQQVTLYRLGQLQVLEVRVQIYRVGHLIFLLLTANYSLEYLQQRKTKPWLYWVNFQIHIQTRRSNCFSLVFRSVFLFLKSCSHLNFLLSQFLKILATFGHFSCRRLSKFQYSMFVNLNQCQVHLLGLLSVHPSDSVALQLLLLAAFHRSTV